MCHQMIANQINSRVHHQLQKYENYYDVYLFTLKSQDIKT